MLAKIYIGTMAAIIWGAAVVGKHFWPDIDTAAIVLACSNVLTGLGVYHVAGPAQPLVQPQPERRPDMGQGGFVRIGVLVVLAGLALLLSGCASVTSAGHAAYTITRSADGRSFELSATDGKEFAGRSIMFDAIRGHLVVQEGESKAFRGQAISAKALSVFPVTDLGNILSGGQK
jgi:hypothetical protein